MHGKGGTYPTGQPSLFDPRPGYPVDANELSSNKPATGVLTNLPLTPRPKLGDIISFAPDPSDPAPEGNTSLLFGNGIYISARRGQALGGQVEDGVQITKIPTNETVVYRTFHSTSDTSHI